MTSGNMLPRNDASPPVYSLILPIYNDESVLPLLARRITKLLDALDAAGEAIFVDNGSRDTSVSFLREVARRDSRFKLIELSKNSGNQKAISAGLDAAEGPATIVMDTNLRESPEAVFDIIAEWKQGSEIVPGGVQSEGSLSLHQGYAAGGRWSGNRWITAEFDNYRSNYVEVVEDSVRFSGLKHDFFLRSKIAILDTIVSEKHLSDEKQPLRALDVGCGIGAIHPFIQGLLPQLSGCDISAESITRAKQDNPWVDYRSYQPPDLPYPDDTFDFALTVCVVHHVSPADRPSFFSELRRVVRPGGVVCVLEHNPFNPLTRLAVMRCPFDEDAVLLNRWQAEKMLRAAGLRDIESQHFLLLPMENRMSRAAERWLSGLPLGAQYASTGVV